MSSNSYLTFKSRLDFNLVGSGSSIVESARPSLCTGAS